MAYSTAGTRPGKRRGIDTSVTRDRVLEAAEDLHRLFEESDGELVEAIRDREPEDAERVLVLRVDGDDVLANALGLFGLIERAIEGRFLDGRVELLARELLQRVLVGHLTSRPEEKPSSSSPAPR